MLPNFIFGEGFDKKPVKGWSGPVKPEKDNDNPVVGWDDGTNKKKK